MSAASDSTVLQSGGASEPARPAPEDYSDRWEAIWGAGLERGQRFDAAAPSPAFVDLLKSGRVDVKGTRVLVPGCGRGYDLPVFLAAGASQVVGLELSCTAAKEAEVYLDEAVAAAKGAVAGDRSAMQIAVGDFFLWTDAQGDSSWDVGFDYTFGCAMHPSMRQSWATHWSRHVRPGGLLVTLVFPIKPDEDPNVGPPFPVSPQLYTQLLGPHGFECIFEEAVPSELSHPPRAGIEAMMVWRKK